MSHEKNSQKPIRRSLETFSFHLAKAVIPYLPRTLIVGTSTLAGILAYHLCKRERTIGMANLNTVFGNTKSTAEKQTILKKSLGSFSLTMADLFWFSRHTDNRVTKYQRIIPSPPVCAENRAQILITAHAGNWELIGLESGLRGWNVASVAAITKNPSIDKHLNALRQKTGQTIIPREGALRALLGRLRNQGKAAFVLDQNTSPKKGGIWVDFLGMPTPVSSAPAHLAYRTGAEIIFAFSQPIGKGHR
jgi:KDO2-lipid IV(A) lauroyltransferase